MNLKEGDQVFAIIKATGSVRRKVNKANVGRHHKMRISVLILRGDVGGVRVNGAEVNVYAAASLTDATKEIASAYEKEKWRQNIV